ncbi:hypothetical protein T484DRAFT_1849779 [Baffinella frigidus]|nr:hypothetical protein T484DRAFT_1849779 [Cryptophyta sp. CCMP2293]
MRAVPVGLALLLVAFVSPSTGRSTRGLVGAPPLETRAWEANCAVNNVAPGPARGAGLFLSRLRGAGEDGAQIGGRMGDLAMMADRQGFDIGASLGGEAAAPSPFHLGNATVAEEDRVARATKASALSSLACD